MRSLSSRAALSLAAGLALLAAGCSTSRAAAPQPTAVKHSVIEGQTYVASPSKHFQALSEAQKREAEAAKANARSGAPATHVSRPATPARSYPEPTSAASAPATCAPAPCVPDPCCDPCCPGGKCGIPAPAFPGVGR